jgi:hypothetical protein
MTKPILYPFKHGPRDVLGYRKNGSPIHPIAGATNPPEPVAPTAPPNGVPTPTPPGNTITIPKPSDVVPPPTVPTGQTFTAEDIERARKQEKDKLYERIEEMSKKLSTFETDHSARLKAEEDARKAAEAVAEAERQQNLTWEQKFNEAQSTFQKTAEELQGQIAASQAVFHQERSLQALMEARKDRLTAAQDDILPELHDWIQGTTPEEIEANIVRAKETTARIVAGFQQHQQQTAAATLYARQQARGTGLTGAPPAVTPVDGAPGQTQTMTADDIRNMDLGTYMKNRENLLAAASQQAYRR